MKEMRWIGDIVDLNTEDLWKIHVQVKLYYVGPLWKYPSKSIKFNIGTPIGYRCTEYECAMKEMRWIGDIVGLNSEDLWEIYMYK